MNISPLPNRHKYAAEIEGYRPGIIRRILQVLHLVKRPKSTSEANWHYSDIDIRSYLTTIHGERDGHKFVVAVVESPLNHRQIPVAVRLNG
jgi:hypothetical protein